MTNFIKAAGLAGIVVAALGRPEWLVEVDVIAGIPDGG